jgi:hypothetical protein
MKNLNHHKRKKKRRRKMKVKNMKNLNKISQQNKKDNLKIN